MSIPANFITFFISCVFALFGIFDYLVADSICPMLWIVSFLALLATVGIDVIERVHIERRVEQLLNDEGLPLHLRRLAD